MPVDRDSCRRLWRFSDSCYGGYGAGGQQAGRSHRLRTNRYEYSVTDKPWARQQLIYHGTGIHGLRCAAAVRPSSIITKIRVLLKREERVRAR